MKLARKLILFRRDKFIEPINKAKWLENYSFRKKIVEFEEKNIGKKLSKQIIKKSKYNDSCYRKKK